MKVWVEVLSSRPVLVLWGVQFLFLTDLGPGSATRGTRFCPEEHLPSSIEGNLLRLSFHHLFGGDLLACLEH